MLEDLRRGGDQRRRAQGRGRRRRRRWSAMTARPRAAAGIQAAVLTGRVTLTRDPACLDELTQALRCLPGVGPKAAQRMALHLLQHDREGGQRPRDARWKRPRARSAIASAATRFTEDELCALCRSSKRDAAHAVRGRDARRPADDRAHAGVRRALFRADGTPVAARRHRPEGDPASTDCSSARADGEVREVVARDQFHQRRRGDRALHRRAAAAPAA